MNQRWAEYSILPVSRLTRLPFRSIGFGTGGVMKKLFTSEVASKGGRGGTVRAADGSINTQLGNPLKKDGPGGPNPETFFAAAYSACFHGALQNAAKKHQATLTDSTVTVKASLNEDDQGGYFLSVEILASLPGVDKTLQQKILDTAHETCPYSKLTRGGTKVELKLV
jgi:osmotically inducible protein OsmC